MKKRDGSFHGWPRRLVLASGVLLAPVACVHEKGESQVPWLQSSMEAEFPDHESPIALDNGSAGKLKGVNEAPSAAAQHPAVTAPTTLPTEAPHATVPAGDEASRGETAAARAPAAPPAAVDPNAKQELEHGLALLHANALDQALTAFSAFLARWPDQPGAEPALYGSGECYFAKGELVAAADAFGTAIRRFPHGARVPDGLLRLGECAERLGRTDAAKTYFDRLALEFPNSDAVRRIPHTTAGKLSQH